MQGSLSDRSAAFDEPVHTNPSVNSWANLSKISVSNASPASMEGTITMTRWQQGGELQHRYLAGVAETGEE
jgi:hypothetical protein